MNKPKYYSINPILTYAPDALYYVIFGERSNGKTFSCLEYVLMNYIEHGQQAAYIRRYAEDLKGKRAMELFEGFTNNLTKGNYIKTLTKNKWDSVMFYMQSWWLAKATSDGMERDSKPFMYKFVLTEYEHDKGASYIGIRTIIFDEFLAHKYYLPDEFKSFMNTLSTIIRKDRDDVKIFMLGNTVNKYSPYFEEMGLNRVKDMKQGTIDVYEYGDSGLRVAVEYADSPEKKKKVDKYFAFSNPSLKMITSGAWEIDIYPHKPCDFSKGHIKFIYFVKFAGEVLQCEIVHVDKLTFTFIHRKTTPIKDDENDLIYSQEPSPRRNRSMFINRPRYRIEKTIWSFFTRQLVFYQSNEIGEIMRNYIAWCNQNY